MDRLGVAAAPHARGRGGHARLRRAAGRRRRAVGPRRPAARPRLRAPPGPRDGTSADRPPGARVARPLARGPARDRLARGLPRRLARQPDGEGAVRGRRAVRLPHGVRVRAPAGHPRADAEVGQEEDEDAGLRRGRVARRATPRRRGAGGGLRRARRLRRGRAGGALKRARAGRGRGRRLMADGLRVVVLDGDETGQELLEQSVRVLDSSLLGVELELAFYDLSLEKRRETGNEIVHEAARAMREAGYGLKAATITPEGRDDVGSPNRILREEVDGKVIVRTGRRIPGVVGPVSGVYHPISVVRMAVDDAYGAKQWREGSAEGADDEIAYRTEKITRSTCRAVAEYSFRTAERLDAKVYGGPKWTVSPVYEGMLKEEMDAAAFRHPAVVYEPVLIDAT